MKLSMADEIAFCTTRIECDTPKGKSTGTGFFYQCATQADTHVPVIVTNKHVVANATRGRFHLTPQNDKDEPDYGKHFAVDLDFTNRWIPHPDAGVDLCVLPLAPLWNERPETKKVFFRTLNAATHIKPDELLESTALENIVMVGYPNGLWDAANNMPLMRRGVTASHIALDWNGKSEFLIDAACYPGSSGSPVFLLDIGGYTTRSGGTMIGPGRLRFLGVLYAGPQQMVTGEIRVVTVPTGVKPISESYVSINLGIVIKARRLNEFDALFANAETA